jgi:hypothetical protein
MGISPNHASSVHLVRNLQTGSITPQFHLVFDDFFETVFSEGEQEPNVWPELVVFQRFANELDEDDYRPELADEWLNPTELQDRVTDREEERQRILNNFTNQNQRHGNFIRRAETNNDNRIANVPAARAGEQPHDPPLPMTSEANDPQPQPTVDDEPLQAPAEAPEPIINQPQRRYPLRNRKPTKRLIEEDGFYATTREWIFMGRALINRWRTTQSDYRYIVALLTSVDTLGLEGVHPAIAQFPAALKASKKDPDSPTFQEAMTGLYREEFLEAMRTEVSELESHQCWDVMQSTEVPEGAKVLPTMWVFKIKRYPDGRVRRFKARLVVRGDFQVEGEDYDEKYAPVVPWSTVRLMLSIAASQGLATRQVDFSNVFVQAHLQETKPIFVQSPPTFNSDIADKVVL